MKTLSKRGKQLLVIACALYAFNSVLIALQTYVNSRIISCAEVGDGKGALYSFVAALVLFLFGYLMSAVAVYARLAFVADGELTMKKEIMTNLFRRPVQSFRGKDDAFYLNLLTTDTDMYRGDYLSLMPFLFSSLAAVVASVFMLLKIHPLLFLAAVAMSAIPLFATKPFASLEQKCRVDYSKVSEEYAHVLKETIEGYETIRICSGAESFQNRYEESSNNLQRGRTKYAFVNNMSNETLMSIAGLSSIICFGIGGLFVMRGQLSTGILFAAISYFSSLSNNFTNVTEYLVTIRSTKETVEKLQEQRYMEYPQNKDLLPAATMDIEYNHISFGFEDRVIYKDFSAQFKQNGCYAILGESGSGKTTLLKLLLKYYDNYDGVIKLGGQDIKDVAEDEIYEKVGVVAQTPVLFNASLYENITMFSKQPEPDSEEYMSLLKELKLTALAERVKNQPLGDFGDNISGGERQRIHIARTMCRKPRILFFDEPTTGLDPENVALINDFIFNNKNFTRIVITHNWDKDYLSRFDNVININV